MENLTRYRIPNRLLLLFLLWQAGIIGLSANERALTLAETISLALERNVGLKQSSLQVEQGNNTVEAAKGERQPNLNLSASGNLDYSSAGDESIFDAGGGEVNDSLRASLSSSVVLYDGGSTKSAVAAAEADLEAVQYDYDRNRQELLLNVVSNYLLAVVRNKQVQIREEELNNLTEQLERIRLDYRSGIRVRSEVLRQEALVAQGKGSLIEAERLHEVALFALKDLLQIPASEKIRCVEHEDMWETFEAIPFPDMGQSSKLLTSRLDLEAQRARMESAEQSLRVARAGRSATISASGSLSSAYSSSMDGGFSERFIEREPSASAGLVLSLPIFDRRRTQTSIVHSQLQLRQEEFYYENLLQVARSDLYRAFLNLESASAQLMAARDQLASAEEALEAETARYEAGVATLLDLNSIRSTRLDAAVSVEQARADLFTSRLEVSFEDGSIETFLLAQLKQLDSNTINLSK